MAQKIIGRKQEIKELLDLYKENKPVFAVIYGRRRVGKTFLVRELFQDKMSFYHTGLSPYELSGQKIMEQQLTSFYEPILHFRHRIIIVQTQDNAVDVILTGRQVYIH